MPAHPQDGDEEYTLVEIGYESFYNCAQLSSIYIPETVKNIDFGAFGECNGLTELHVSDIDSWFSISIKRFPGEGYPPFSEDDANPLYYAGHLYINGEEVTSYTMPEEATINNFRFKHWTGLTHIEIPNSVTNIARNAFECCSGLT